MGVIGAGCAPEPVWTQRLEEKILCLCLGSNPDRPVVQTVARHYTAWATPAPVCSVDFYICFARNRPDVNDLNRRFGCGQRCQSIPPAACNNYLTSLATLSRVQLFCSRAGPVTCCPVMCISLGHSAADRLQHNDAAWSMGHAHALYHRAPRPLEKSSTSNNTRESNYLSVFVTGYLFVGSVS
jgi:hypothetical protein